MRTGPHGRRLVRGVRGDRLGRNLGGRAALTRQPSTTANGLVFADPEKAKAAVAAYRGKLGFPEWARNLLHPRPITIKLRRDGGLLAEFKYKDKDEDEEDGRDRDAMEAGWIKARGPVWAKLIDVDTAPRQTPYESLADNAVRQVSLNGEQHGLYVHTNDGKWDRQAADRVKDNLTHRGIEGRLQKGLDLQQSVLSGRQTVRGAVPLVAKFLASE